MAKKRASRKPTRSKKPARARTTTRTTRSSARNGGSGRAGSPADTGQTVDGMPLRTVTGQLVVNRAADAMRWYARVFGAKEIERNMLPDGRIMHGVLQIGDTPFMISDNFGPPIGSLNGAYLHIQDKGIQPMWDRAMAEGATEVMALANQFWGQKYGQLRDPFGQVWSLGWPAKMTQAEKDRLQTEATAMLAAAPR